MKLLIFLIPFIAFTACNRVNSPNDTLTKEKLTSIHWLENEFSNMGNFLIFDANNKYTIEFYGEGCGQRWIGEYELLDSKRVLLKTGIQQTKDCQPDEPERTCEYKKVPNPVLSLFYLDCGKTVFFNVSEKIQSGAQVQFEGVSVTALSGITGVTTDDAKLREKPDVNSKSFSCISEMAPDWIPYVSKNTNLILLFKTNEKQKVKNWENYWYYVTVNGGWYSRCNSKDNQGWIFGEFIKEGN
ncbi:MAG TPA: hypothetical protein PK079_12900 [Leptospiraceae bacterium]|nr:hypothetical protein [Leptospiraceae bacterium]HMW04872.1 hypothetical protein [Leptospiraceae bacterium]HMX32555.1 hypothetical protein [Leptospiraceae bacterium]HMY30907.1 hypothetical protein [Leptospiraceae bacterium]HMZ62711.1 hypothetical protein [Leptospiraceae bacterium]